MKPVAKVLQFSKEKKASDLTVVSSNCYFSEEQACNEIKEYAKLSANFKYVTGASSKKWESVKNAKINRFEIAESSAPGLVYKGSDTKSSNTSADGSKAKQGAQ